jgi:HPt (histidine-containing phosphotransfer) domain-containing protein
MALEDDEDAPGNDSFSVAIRRGAAAEAAAGGATVGEGVFDDTMLNGLRQGLSPDAVRQLIDELFVKAEEIIGDIGKATAANDIPTLAARAHELKGMAANFGLVEVSKLAEKAERAAKDNSTEAMPDVIADLDPANGRAKAAMRKWLSS